jgi:hypothetical protein
MENYAVEEYLMVNDFTGNRRGTLFGKATKALNRFIT